MDAGLPYWNNNRFQDVDGLRINRLAADNLKRWQAMLLHYIEGIACYVITLYSRQSRLF